MAGAAAFAALGTVGLGGCGEKAAALRFGTMPTEDSFPMWVAEQEGLFAKAGLDDVEIVTFDSAQALSAALTAGEVDIAMTDPMRAVNLCESGTDVVMEWITLGTEAAQGRFGVLVAGDSGYTSLADIVVDAARHTGEEWGVGVGANTVPEYVLDRLCEDEGIDPADLPTVEVASLPDRYGMVASGQLPAAALPASLLAFGEANGLKVLVDDTTGDNISQSVMVARSAYLEDEAGQRAVEQAAEAWDAAVALINDNPDSYRSLLVESANLNEAVAETYPVPTYPEASLGHPVAALITPQIEWMEDKGYLEASATYDEGSGTVSIG